MWPYERYINYNLRNYIIKETEITQTNVQPGHTKAQLLLWVTIWTRVLKQLTWPGKIAQQVMTLATSSDPGTCMMEKVSSTFDIPWHACHSVCMHAHISVHGYTAYTHESKVYKQVVYTIPRRVFWTLGLTPLYKTQQWHSNTLWFHFQFFFPLF